jgi:hypothetical protein
MKDVRQVGQSCYWYAIKMPLQAITPSSPTTRGRAMRTCLNQLLLQVMLTRVVEGANQAD